MLNVRVPEIRQTIAMAKMNVFVTRSIPLQGMALLDDERLNVKSWNRENAMPKQELMSSVSGVDGIICMISDAIDKEVLDAAGSKLKVISTMSVGTEHIDRDECGKRNIKIFNIPDIASDSAAEFTVTLVLLVARRLLEGMNAVIKGEWGLWKPMWICGFEMGGRTLGLYGFGRVGFGVARRLKPFNVSRIIYYDTCQQDYANSVDATLVDMDTLINESDMLCICCSLTPTTKKSVNKEFLGKMKEDSILVNTSRAAVVDQEALDEALKAGRPMAAALDLTEPEPLPAKHPLRQNPKCIITPHLATATITTRVNMAIATVNNLLTELFKAGEPTPEAPKHISTPPKPPPPKKKTGCCP